LPLKKVIGGGENVLACGSNRIVKVKGPVSRKKDKHQEEKGPTGEVIKAEKSRPLMNGGSRKRRAIKVRNLVWAEGKEGGRE